MIQISEESIRMLIDSVKNDKIEVHIEFTPENTIIEIQPWKPIEMTGCLLNRHLEPNRTNFCPTCGADMRGEKHETD